MFIRRAFCFFLTYLVAGSCFLQAQQGSTSRSIVQAVTGTWRLVSTEELLKDGTVRPYPDLGPDAKGYLIYAADGHMCVELMKPGRPAWNGKEEQGSDEEKTSAASGFTAYCGRYTVDHKKHVITHLPDVSFFPNFLGTSQERPYRFEGNRMIFSGVEPDGDVARWTIIWEKAKR